jgi:1-acyl-sn-glycerol-3-phosphate acyltransferase
MHDRRARLARAWIGSGVVSLSRIAALGEKAWRLPATGLGFAVFFLGGALAALTVLPMVGLLARDAQTRHDRTRVMIRRMFRLYIAMLRALRVLSVEIHGREELGRIEGKLIVANHPTLLDVVLLIALVPRVQCIVKHQLWQSRYLGGVVRQAGYIRNDLPSEQLLEACRSSLAAGCNLIVFPEGTRTLPEQPVRFHRGFANIALLTGADIQTVSIRCNPMFLMKGQPWWQIPPTPPKFTVRIGAALDIREASRDVTRPRAARAVVSSMEKYYAGISSNG